MDVVLFLLAFTMFWKSTQCVQCYVCSPESVSFEKRQTCQYFDSDAKYIENCDSSTMCFKKITTLDIGNGLTSTSEERGCAAQTMNGDQRKINGKWQFVHDIYEVYEESCKEKVTEYQRATKSIACYCRGDLCNNARKTHSFGLVIPISILILYSLTK